jgi:hypothetical protein
LRCIRIIYIHGVLFYLISYLFFVSSHIFRTDASQGFEVGPTQQIKEVAVLRKELVAWKGKENENVVTAPVQSTQNPKDKKEDKKVEVNQPQNVLVVSDKNTVYPELSLLVAKKLVTPLSKCLPLNELVDLILSLIRYFSDPVTGASVQAALLAKGIIDFCFCFFVLFFFFFISRVDHYQWAIITTYVCSIYFPNCCGCTKCCCSITTRKR